MGSTINDCKKLTCSQCEDEKALGFEFTMAFQPIIDCFSNRIFGYEA